MNATPPSDPDAATPPSWLDRLSLDPMLLRAAPWAIYLLLLIVAQLVADWPAAYAAVKLAQVAVVITLVWRTRRRLRELTVSLHWAAIPVGLLITVGWIVLHDLTAGSVAAIAGPGSDAEPPAYFANAGPLGWIALVAHLVAMTTAVPIVEELFNRSLVLRAVHRPRPTGRGVLQALCDMPGVGDLLAGTRAGLRVTAEPNGFREQFEQTPVGALTVFSVVLSSAVFAMVHHPMDWPGAMFTGVVLCLLLSRTRRHGLGPVIWAHAVANLALWGYVVVADDWRFL